jgi:asparagine synthase (glutamine-hydrolysing)
MSAIAGVVHVDGREASREQLSRLRAATPYLGRDGVDTWCEGPAGLVRFALRVTPQSLTEVQPCRSAATGGALVLDGRLDNRDEMRRRLGADAPPSSAPDAQIVLAALERFGDDAVQDFAGDYALAYWRADTRRLFCARSPVGWRPFLWTFDGRRFGFATEPRTLVEGLNLERKLNEAVIGEHLAARLISQTETFWQGVWRLPPGFALVLQGGQVRTWRWLEGPFEDLTDLPEKAHIEQFRDLFDQSLIAAHRSTGLVAAHLSGGLDSSTVVCRSMELFREGRIASAVQPISTRFYGEPNDEGPWIEAVERHAGVKSIHVTPVAFDTASAAEWCSTTYQQPLRPNVLCTYTAVCQRLQGEGARVLLSGEGGDDWLSGSRAHWPDLLLTGRWKRLIDEGLDQGGGTVPGKLRMVALQSLGPIVSRTQRERFLRPHLDFTNYSPDWLRPEWAARIGLEERWRTAPTPPPLGSFAQRQRYHVYTLARRHMYIDNLLTYVASQNMELRHPFHDLRLTRFFMGCAGGVLTGGGWRKRLLRKTMENVLPEEVRTRTSKSNFTPSMTDAICRRFEERPPEDLMCAKLGWVDPARLRQIHQDYVAWTAAGAQGVFPSASYAPVWNAISVDLWLEHAFRL